MAKLNTESSRALGPRIKEINRMAEAMSDDIALSCAPATVNLAAGVAAGSRAVQVKLVNALGNVHTWYNKVIASEISASLTSGNTSLVSGQSVAVVATITFVKGVANTAIYWSAATWATAATDTLKVGPMTILGATVASAISVQTRT